MKLIYKSLILFLVIVISLIVNRNDDNEKCNFSKKILNGQINLDQKSNDFEKNINDALKCHFRQQNFKVSYPP